MNKLREMLEEMDQAQMRADELKRDITGILIEERHLDLLTVNWRRLRQWLRRR